MQTGHRFALGAVVVLVGLVFLLIRGVEQSSARHVTLTALLTPGPAGAVDGDRLQLGGCTVVEGSIEWDPFRHRPTFTVTDGDRLLAVRYVGDAVLPDTFKDRAQVVLEGRYHPGGPAGEHRFEADVIFAKCPSKYEGGDYDLHLEAQSGLQPGSPSGVRLTVPSEDART